ncbi:SAM hydrolase/SAM-dependent halogenase family protein [Halodesulfovibrio aestuarii]|uniref:SAM hydrolase/SAM-dependent halogenase family protein n=1 Tax=Halodesulfovibrio aestuarii TaxID=126333 RepID=UPI003D356495
MSLKFFLLTDFGYADPYVGQMKGVLSTLAPQYQIFDITHNLAPFNIAQAGFFLDSTIDHLPPYSVTICVVDPGVGTARDIVCMVIDTKVVLAPDNGCLSFLHTRYPKAPIYRIMQHQLPLEHTILTSTFHGRTLFSPLAADIALHIEQLSSYMECTRPAPFSKDSTQDCKLKLFPPLPTDSESILTQYMERNDHSRAQAIVMLPESVAKLDKNIIETYVLHIDTFGNVILGLPNETWHKRISDGGELTLYTQTTRPLKCVSAYAELAENQIGIICGSQGYLEIACNMCSAAQFINLKLGERIRIALSVPPEM